MKKVKYKEYAQRMYAEHKELFMQFKLLHDNFARDRNTYQVQYNEQGKAVLEIIREWERRLCAGMEKGQYANYSTTLSEKFWQEIKKDYPKIELVGIESSFE